MALPTRWQQVIDQNGTYNYKKNKKIYLKKYFPLYKQHENTFAPTLYV